MYLLGENTRISTIQPQKPPYVVTKITKLSLAQQRQDSAVQHFAS